jgi:hypothetical protein
MWLKDFSLQASNLVLSWFCGWHQRPPTKENRQMEILKAASPNKTAKNSRFQRGSGVYSCQSCKRQTRASGGDNEDVRLCFECYEISGLENQISDACQNDPNIENWEKEIKQLEAAIIAKGGTL